MHTDADRCLSRRLDREWSHLCRRPGVVETVRSWGLTELPFGSLDELLTLTGRHAAASPDADAVLRRLVGIAATEPLACRIVLQRILPGLLAIVKVEQSRDPRIDAFDLLIGEAWISIMRYRTDTRPTDVAARLLQDARHRAFTSHRRRRVVEEIACDSEVLAESAAENRRSPFDDLVGMLTDARRRGLAEHHVETVRDYLAHGSSAGVAEARSVTERAVRYRHQRAVKQIRRLVAAA